MASASVRLEIKKTLCFTHQHWLGDVPDPIFPRLELKESLFVRDLFEQHRVVGLELGDVAPICCGQVDVIVDQELPALFGDEGQRIQDVVDHVIRGKPRKAHSGKS